MRKVGLVKHHASHPIGKRDTSTFVCIPVNGDATQVQDAGRGEVYVQAVPEVAHELTE